MKVCFVLWIGITVELADSEPLHSKQTGNSEPLSYNQFAYLLHRPTVKYLISSEMGSCKLAVVNLQLNKCSA